MLTVQFVVVMTNMQTNMPDHHMMHHYMLTVQFVVVMTNMQTNMHANQIHKQMMSNQYIMHANQIHKHLQMNRRIHKWTVESTNESYKDLFQSQIKAKSKL